MQRRSFGDPAALIEPEKGWLDLGKHLGDGAKSGAVSSDIPNVLTPRVVHEKVPELCMPGLNAIPIRGLTMPGRPKTLRRLRKPQALTTTLGSGTTKKKKNATRRAQGTSPNPDLVQAKVFEPQGLDVLKA